MSIRRREEVCYMLQPANKSDRMCHLVAMTVRSSCASSETQQANAAFACVVALRNSGSFLNTHLTDYCKPGFAFYSNCALPPDMLWNSLKTAADSWTHCTHTQVFASSRQATRQTMQQSTAQEQCKPAEQCRATQHDSMKHSISQYSTHHKSAL